MAKVIERARARYEVEQLAETACEKCGAEHAAIVGEALHARPEDRGDRPWRYLQPCTPTRGA